MERLLEKTSIMKHATPHILRHTHISMLTEDGVDLPTIMKRMGYDDIRTTMKIYTHVTEKMKEDASQKVQQTFGSILNMDFIKKCYQNVIFLSVSDEINGQTLGIPRVFAV
ncbi:tyrosine-type recombinase/integrase [Bacillus glycinifermentans]|nr:tyrosine-type recombinase/integrase [Bacillus glycinifermentans]MEC0486169.1 tyrosine-type recombinase/integrase [Bacillus glycinifermentans]